MRINTGEPSTAKIGRPPTDPLEYARTAWWVRSVQLAARKPLDTLEREISPETIKPRDEGGWSQPYAWRKYASGARAASSSLKNKQSVVSRAEDLYKGTAAQYHSVTWDLLYSRNRSFDKNTELTHRIAPSVLKAFRRGDIEHKNSNRIILSPRGFARAAEIRHIDALGLMLMFWRAGYQSRINPYYMYWVRLWVKISSRSMFQFRTTRHLFLPLLEERLFEIGLLTGLGGISLQETQEEAFRQIHLGIVFSQIPALLPIRNGSGDIVMALVNEPS